MGTTPGIFIAAAAIEEGGETIYCEKDFYLRVRELSLT